MRHLLILFVLSLSTVLFSQTRYSSLTVSDPQQWWSSTQGSLDKADFSFYPVDRFIAVNIYLTLSAKGVETNFNSTAMLEAVLDFDLPANAFVTDLWLWVEDDIIRGRIYDVWTASQIYENIVNRRRDPALLKKLSATDYQLRVFPFKRYESRRVKISYMVPANMTESSASTFVPMEIILAARNKPAIVNALFWPDGNWDSPVIHGISNLPTGVLEPNGGGLGPVYRYYLYPDVHTDAALTLTTTLKTGKKYLLTQYRNQKNEGFYQVTVFPSRIRQSVGEKKRVIFGIDIPSGKSRISNSSLLTYLKTAIPQYLTDNEEFTIVFGGFTPSNVSGDWTASDTASVNALFKNSGNWTISGYSALPGLLGECIRLSNESSVKSEIVLVASGDAFGTSESANPLLNDVLSKRTKPVTISTLDINDINIQYFWVGSNWYYGNDYFSSNLAIRTGGQHYSIRNGENFYQLFEKLVTQVGDPIRNYELDPDVTSGLAYHQFRVETSNIINSSTPLTQVGRFAGTSIGNIQYLEVGESSQPVLRTLTPDDGEVTTGDSLTAIAWFGNYIRSLELNETSNMVRQEIIRASAESRVLSKYTAFLALEPSDTVKPCLECRDETEFTDVNDEKPTQMNVDSVLTAHPNPFNPATTLTIRLPEGIKSQPAVLRIFNILGQLVYQQSFDKPFGTEPYRLTWEARNLSGDMLPSGLYLVTLQTGKERFTRKITLLK